MKKYKSNRVYCTQSNVSNSSNTIQFYVDQGDLCPSKFPRVIITTVTVLDRICQSKM